MWWRFNSLEAFDAWHVGVCEAAGLPRPGVNQLTGEVEPDAQWTTGVAIGLVQPDGSVVAFIPSPWATPTGAVPADAPEGS